MSNIQPAGVKRWNNFFNNLNWKNIFLKSFRTTIDCQLKWFQYRILHRILPTRRYLFLCNIIDSPQCSFCDREEETIHHLLWQCQVVTVFWRNLKTELVTACPHMNNFDFSEELVIFGVKENVQTDDAFDFILLLAKYFIYKSKFTKTLPPISVFKKYLEARVKIERYLYTKLDRCDKFHTTWQIYKKWVNYLSLKNCPQACLMI